MTGITMIAASILASGCQPQEMTPTSKDVSRAEMARSLASVQVGMTELEATAICGEGKLYQFQEQKDGYLLRYGVVGEGVFGTLGSIAIEDGKVISVRGGEGTVIDPWLMKESEVRAHLSAIGDLPYLVIAGRHIGEPAWPPETIRCVNALHQLGKLRAMAILKEYVRVRFGTGYINELDHIAVVARLLFKEKAQVPDLLSGMIPRPEDRALHMHYPVMTFEGLPLLSPIEPNFKGLFLKSFPELDLYEKSGELIDSPIRGPMNPFSALLKASQSPAWPSPNWWASGQPKAYSIFEDEYKSFRNFALAQALSLCDGLKADFKTLDTHEEWETTVRYYEGVFEESGYKWDQKRCMYILNGQRGLLSITISSDALDQIAPFPEITDEIISSGL